ncbi:hypothetical protein [Pseudomonas sp. 58(2021)]|uniref:hypothetical protein n=1 Tax=Pseudomonas sp. 58(2021) TaxID=2813330 RepID=UPI001AA00C5F|nr:hypothetical protein [Pseudomonas sp. 58(2021)]
MNMHDANRSLEEIRAQQRSIFGVAICSLLALVVALFLGGADDPYPNAALLMACVSLFAGLFVFFSYMEMTLAKHLVNFRATVIIWVVLLTLLGYIGKIRAGNDINHIFHTDSGVFPLTLFAATVLHVADLLKWLVGGVMLILILVTWLARREVLARQNGIIIFCTHVVIIVTLFLASVLIWGRVSSEDRRLQFVYRLAHIADFNSSFRCKGISDERFSVVFLDGNKTRVLVAEKIESDLYYYKKAEIFQPVSVPEEFPQMDCVYESNNPTWDLRLQR